MLTLGNPVFYLDFFTGVNFLFLFLSAGYFFYLLKTKTYLIIKPSFIFLFYVFLFFQIPLPFYSYECEKFIPNYYSLVPMIHGFVLLGLFFTSFLFAPQTQAIWEKLNTIEKNNKIEKSYTMFLLFVFSLTFLSIIVYFNNVSLWDTSLMLYLRGADVKTISLSREYSLKTLNSEYPKYIYSIMRSCFALCVVAFGSYSVFFSIKEKKYQNVFLYLILMGLSIVFSSFVLTKSVISIILISVFFNAIWMNVHRPYIAFLWIVLGIVSALLISIIVASGVYGKNFDIISSVMPILNRTFVVPLKIGTWYVHYAQTHGFVGISFFPKLATFMGEPSINLPNFIGRMYCPVYFSHSVTPTVSANAGFLFSNYASWGSMGLSISLLMLFSLDFPLILMQHLSRNYLVPFLSVIGVQLISFTASGYGVCMITHGYFISFMLMSFWFYKKNIHLFCERLVLSFKKF